MAAEAAPKRSRKQTSWPKKLCEDCGARHKHFGLPGSVARRWCTACAKAHPGAVSLSAAVCEDCARTIPEFGLPSVTNARGFMVKRWCSKCSTAHPGATRPAARLCADGCGSSVRIFGMPEGKPQWCRKCADNHPGAVMDGRHQKQAAKAAAAKREKGKSGVKCVDCGLKAGGYGPADGSRTNVWCFSCAKGSHPGRAGAARSFSAIRWTVIYGHLCKEIPAAEARVMTAPPSFVSRLCQELQADVY